MSAKRTSARLLRAYPTAWRRRYGDELENLIVEASDGDRVGWRTRFDVVRAGGRERLVAAIAGPSGDPRNRVRESVLQVLWAWALFVVGGLILQRFSEHWQSATPSSAGALPSLAFGVLVVAAACGTVLVLAGAAATVPSLIRFLRDGGWPQIRRRVVVAAVLSAIALAATAGLVSWAAGLGQHQRDGGDLAYAIAFIGSALLACGSLVAWTAALADTARRIEIGPVVMRLEGWLSAGVALTMLTVTTALVLWWIALASAERSFLAGHVAGGVASTMPQQLLLATALIGAATLLAGAAALRAVRRPRI